MQNHSLTLDTAKSTADLELAAEGPGRPSEAMRNTCTEAAHQWAARHILMLACVSAHLAAF